MNVARICFVAVLFALPVWSGAAIPISELARTEPVHFGKEIHPLFKKNCLACHNASKAKAGLNLESPDQIRKGGESGAAVVPGKSGESLLLTTAAHLDEDLLMPPPGNKVKASNLTSDELALLKLWIDQGAVGDAPRENHAQPSWRGSAPRRAAVNAVAVSPDGRLAAIARGNRLALCEMQTGRTLALLNDPALAKEGAAPAAIADRDAVMSAAFGADDFLATGGFRTVKLWRRIPREAGRDFGALPESATSLAISPNGEWATAGGEKGQVWLWSMKEEKFAPFELKEHGASINALIFSPDNDALLSVAADKKIVVWRLSDRSVVFREESPVLIHAFAFIKSGRELAAGCEDGFVRIWEWPAEAPDGFPCALREFKLQDAAVKALAAHERGLLTLAPDYLLRFVNPIDGSESAQVAIEKDAARSLAEVEVHLRSAEGLAAARKGQVSAAAEKLKKESETARSSAQSLAKALTESRKKSEEADAAAGTLRAMPEEKSLADAVKKTADALKKAEAAVRASKVNAELGGRLAGDAAAAHVRAELQLASAEASVVEAQARVEAVKKSAALPLPPTVRIAVAPKDVRVLLGASDGSSRHVSWEDGVLLESPDIAGMSVFTPGGELLTVDSKKRVRLTAAQRSWRLERIIGSPDDPQVLADRVNAVAISPDGKVLATGGGVPTRDGELKLWRAEDGKLMRHITKAHADAINAVAFSPDGDFLATAGSDRIVRVWRVADGERVANLEGHSAHVASVSWRSDGLALASGGADRTLRIWDVAAQKQTKSGGNFGSEVSAVTFVGVGDLLLAACGDKSVRLGDQALPQSGGYPFCAASDRTGKAVVVGSHDGVVRVWNVKDRKLLRALAE